MSERSFRQIRLARIQTLGQGDPELLKRVQKVFRFSSRIRVSEYHATNACNIRCQGCWFFAFGHDHETRENRSLEDLGAFLDRERKQRRVNSALVIGGEPTLVLDRLRLFREKMRYLTISTNGLEPLPRAGFEDVAIGVTLFGGGALDDELRGIRPSGRRFEGLFDRALENYAGDARVGFVYALTEEGIDFVEPTVRRIGEAGLRVTFNFYSKYGADDPLAHREQGRLLEEALRVQAVYPDVVMSHPHYIRAMITGESHGATFGYDVCPSLSVDHPAHEGRLRNGNPTLPLFNTWGADLRTVKLCCTSGKCDGCRDSQAVHSWLLVSIDHFLESRETLRTWVEIAEAYWSQFVWSPYHPVRRAAGIDEAQDPVSEKAA